MTNIAPAITFGAGSVFGFASGQTPVKLGVLQDVEIDFDASIKELFGQQQFAVAVGRGQTKITGKAKMGQFDGHLLSSLFFNTALATGFPDLVENEAHTVASTTQQVTNHTGFLADLGVYYASTGIQLEQVAAGAEATGKYSVAPATGTYTFAVGDEVALLFSYSWTNTGGHSTVITNQNMGTQPTFQLFMKQQFTNFGVTTGVTINLNRCVSSKLSAPFKNTDFSIPDFDFSCFADNLGNVGTWGFTT